MNKIEVPLNYRPNLIFFFRNDRNRWQLEYDLPAAKKVRMIMTLPKETSARSVKKIAEEKTSDLNKGLLTEKEYSKISELEAGLTIAEGLQKYLVLSALGKGNKTKFIDRTRVPRVFSYFMNPDLSWKRTH